MPEINLGRVVGPQGEQGIQGETGPAGAQGIQGPAGQDATINGVPAITIKAGNRIDLAQKDSELTISAAVNQNLIINSDFRAPVNRNGKIVYTAGGHTIDKWAAWNIGKAGVLSIVSDGIKLEGEEQTSIVLEQALDERLDLYGKVVTISILVESVVGKFELQIMDSFSKEFSEPGLISITGVIKKVENYKPRFRVFNNQSNSSCIIKAAKAELGGHQTLARQNDAGEWELIDPPNYALQYALCSQYSPITGEWVGSQHSNPNLLDNWYFADPINQRGQTEYTGAVYTIDRWFNGHSELITRVEDDCISCTGTGLNLQQIISSNLAGQTVCMSVLCAGNINLVIGYLRNGEYQYPVMVKIGRAHV